METTLHFPGHTLWSWAVVSLLAVTGVTVLLWRLRPGRGRRLVVGLRLTALGGVLLAFLQPAIRVEEVVRARSPVLVVVDESASMQARDSGGLRRSERVAEFFRQHAAWADDIEQRHDVRHFACSDHVRPVGRAGIETPWPPRGASTDLKTCLEEALAAAGSREVSGIILVSDGADPEPAAQGRMDVPSPVRSTGPLWVLLAAEPDEPFRDVAIADVGGLDFALARNLADVHVRILSAGLEPQTVPATLSLDGEVVASRDVSLPGDGAVAATLSFLPREAGRHLLQIEVPVLPGEASEENNRVSMVVNVVRDRLRVLHVAGHPSWDERFLRETLRRKRGVELISFHTLRDPESALDLPEDGETLLIPFPAEEIFVRSIESFDLIVLQDYELPEADRDRFAASLERYVREGGGLLFLGGSATLGAQGPWPEHLARLLPVPEPLAPKRGMMPGRFQAMVPIRARGHPVFQAWGGPPGSLIERIRTAPPLPAINILDQVASDAETLIEAAGDPSLEEDPWPLVVVSGHGKGMVGLIATDTLWRWAFDPGAARLYSDLLDGLIAFLTKDPEARRFRVRVERDLVALGQVFGVEVASRSEAGEVTARIERLTGAGTFEPSGVEGRSRTDAEGRAVIRFVADGTGPRRITARVGDEGLEAADVFVVGSRLGEVVNLRPTGKVVQALVRAFGGEVHPLSNPALERFHPKGESSVRTGARVEFPIWDHPSLLLLILTALGLEWYLERRLGQA